MNNFEKISRIFEDYSKSHNVDLPDNFISDLIKTSYDSEGKQSVYTDTTHNLNVLDMDVFAKDVYYHIYGDKKSDNIFNSPDAFLINDRNHWFFIEFKNSPITAKNAKLKSNIIKKAFCVMFSMIDVLFEKRTNDTGFDYENPLSFFRANVTYILVCSNDKNPTVAQRNIQTRQAYGCYHYTPDFMQKLASYLFCDAYVYTEKYFEEEFVKKFKY